MKKCVMFLICVFLLVGCQVHSSQPLSSQFHEKPLDRKVYQYHDYLLYIYENDEKQKGFTFEFELNQSGIGDLLLIRMILINRQHVYYLIKKTAN